MSRIIYSPSYDIGFFGVEKLHPFDSRKYSRAWKRMRRALGPGLEALCEAPINPVCQTELLQVHSSKYLESLKNSSFVAQALELHPLKYLPAFVLDFCVLKAMRNACQGTIIGAFKALDHGFTVNMGGGYHHAMRDSGEGFCIYSDIALGINALRREGRLKKHERVVYIDLDAHQGNGVSHIFYDDSRLFMFDMYNSAIYPAQDRKARERIDCDLGIYGGCSDDQYLETLTDQLPGFLYSIGAQQKIGLVIYNAGTDIYQEDQLGGFQVSAEAIFERDRFVVNQCRDRGLPTLMLLSGGYSSESYKLVADSLIALLGTDLPQPPPAT
jgi:histone deacetylase 11